MAKRWLIGGLAVGVGALAVAPEARTWLRRRLGLEPEDRRWFEEEGAEAPEYEGDEPLDTREARFSLRARLSEDAPPEAEEAPEPEPLEASEPVSVPEPEPESSPFFAAVTPEPAPEPEPESSPFLAAVTPEPEPEPFSVDVTPEPEPEPEPFVAQAAPEPWPRAAEPEAVESEPEVVESEPEVVEPEAAEPEPEVAEPEVADPEPEPAHSFEPESTPFSPPAPDYGYVSYEALPAINPEADAPKTPGEDTDEVGPLPAANSWETPAEEPLPPPTELHPPPPPPSRPFSSDGASFRSAIDAARERVHGAAREATPEDGDGEFEKDV